MRLSALADATIYLWLRAGGEGALQCLRIGLKDATRKRATTICCATSLQCLRIGLKDATDFGKLDVKTIVTVPAHWLERCDLDFRRPFGIGLLLQCLRIGLKDATSAARIDAPACGGVTVQKLEGN